jgi:hypothetical protein
VQKLVCKCQCAAGRNDAGHRCFHEEGLGKATGEYASWITWHITAAANKNFPSDTVKSHECDERLSSDVSTLEISGRLCFLFLFFCWFFFFLGVYRVNNIHVAGKLDCGRGEARSYGTLSRKLRRDPTHDEGLLFDTAKRIWFNHFQVIPLAGVFCNAQLFSRDLFLSRFSIIF